MRRSAAIFLVLILYCTMATILASQDSRSRDGQAARANEALAYHDHLPPTPLPATLRASEFSDNPSAFVAYALASEIRTMLYQVPCYCGCDKEDGHESLLNCFTTKHGALCDLCKKEVIFCFVQRKRGTSPARIRQSLAEGKASRVDLMKYTSHSYGQLQKQAGRQK
jgi:uncharacterized protein with PCYCGC motif